MSETEKDTVTVKIFEEGAEGVEIGISSIIGTRSNQEDTIFGEAQGNEAIAVVCDGMGGLEGGELASKAAVECLVEDWYCKGEITNIPQFLTEEARKADKKVALQKNESGELIHAGTTIVAVIVQDSFLYWLSVGDSKIYIIRGNEIMAVNREHNYRMTLDQQLREGKLTPQEYAAQEYQAEALISYLGMGDVSLMDVNRQPFLLEDGDIVVLSSDGLYRSLTEEEILKTVRGHDADMQSAAESLTTAAFRNRKGGQDNTSVAALRYSEKWEQADGGN